MATEQKPATEFRIRWSDQEWLPVPRLPAAHLGDEASKRTGRSVSDDCKKGRVTKDKVNCAHTRYES